jgi:ribosome-associated protein
MQATSHGRRTRSDALFRATPTLDAEVWTGDAASTGCAAQGRLCITLEHPVASARDDGITTVAHRLTEPRMSQPLPKHESDSLALARRAAALSLDLKANDVVMLDLARVSDATDYFVIASGSSDTHVRAIAEHVMEQLRKEGVRVHHVEGLPQGRWVLLDYIDFVVHVFHPTLRSFYQLERLWGDAATVPLGEIRAST